MPASPPRPTPPASAGARPGGAPADLAAVRAVITGMYGAYTTGERARVDSFLDPDATIWDSATADLLCGKAELDRVRDGRPTDGTGPAEAGLSVHDDVIDVFADLAVARYWLRVDFRDGPPESVRNTAVLRRDGSERGWLIVHLHEDVQEAAGTGER
ncbi:nuclear transport factor 2 family protein [Streptomyces meridianus]|uniref:Nuclear transport factor 2 family protein n=1 Tax=Streptomyces meridianus TaxID=2938945 RepID=A0ABT0X8J9_9ACTN|nr:nuclear transport factor 2 family protein [Streptomyces meridianus]MCM2578860.1 nuclear transport factor 2 family protein [Streptomyces meridianus]